MLSLKIKKRYIVLIIFFLVFKLILLLGYIPSSSMENTIKHNSIILVNRVNKNIHRGDIIVFKYGKKLTVKRVIGINGDTIEIRESRILINGKKIDESYIKGKTKTDKRTKWLVPENSYFVLGDNREDSIDSRYKINPYIKEKNIIGKVIFSFGIL